MLFNNGHEPIDKGNSQMISQLYIQKKSIFKIMDKHNILVTEHARFDWGSCVLDEVPPPQKKRKKKKRLQIELTTKIVISGALFQQVDKQNKKEARLPGEELCKTELS